MLDTTTYRYLLKIGQGPQKEWIVSQTPFFRANVDFRERKPLCHENPVIHQIQRIYSTFTKPYVFQPSKFILHIFR